MNESFSHWNCLCQVCITMSPRPITVNWHLITTHVTRDDHIILNVSMWSLVGVSEYINKYPKQKSTSRETKCSLTVVKMGTMHKVNEHILCYFYVWTSFFVSIIIAFWHVPYAANNTEFSATLATTAGIVPAYNPLLIPSFIRVCRKQSTIPWYRCGNVCIFTLMVSKGWPTYTSPTPPEIASNIL